MSTSSDIEAVSNGYFSNHSVKSLSWSQLAVRVKTQDESASGFILDSCGGYASAGELVALMGPSGSGKTTLLNILANRSQVTFEGEVKVNGKLISKEETHQLCGYVEQDDALIGSLTVQETIDFSAKMALHSIQRGQRRQIVNSLISAFSLEQQKNTIIGTPLQRGISGGQKRRVSVANQLVTAPQVLFLDEPTSSLDSAASYEVMQFISTVAKKYRLIIIVSIHQPSTSTLGLFDRLLLLSKGKTCYFGEVGDLTNYFATVAPIPIHTNPAEYLLELVNTDFRSSYRSAKVSLDSILDHWKSSEENMRLKTAIEDATGQTNTSPGISIPPPSHRQGGARWDVPWILLHRNFIKSYRDFLAYGTRVVMYTGLAVLMGTVWLRLSYVQSSIQPFINALFFGGAFMSFMAVAYVPSIVEDIHALRREHASRLYGPLSFTIANFLVGIPWLLLITLIFSIVSYFLSNFRLAADGFWIWVLWLFLDLLAAESLVVLLSAVFPIFVVALAATAFANGLWMCVGGFLVPMRTLNVFWKYVFHYIDYQAYVFQAMVVNQFKHTVYDCEGSSCMYRSDLEGEGKIRGTAILEAYEYSSKTGKQWEWFGIMLGIIVGYRVLGYIALWFRTRKL